jgi:two-component system, chemotaxis family, protein-glutamate methylesterase/glutaminase
MMAAHAKQARVRVLIVDDSAMIRKVLSLGLASDPGIEVVGTAADGDQALEMVRALAPDVITLDIEMPRSDGVTFLRRMMPQWRVPTVVISGVTREGADVTLQALEAGAVDIIAKPALGIGEGLPQIMADICQRVRAAASSRPVLGHATARDRPKPTAPPSLSAGRPAHHVILIGASTGGVQALSHLLPMLPANAPGIVIVQHMPAGFTGSFAKRLDDVCAIRVREAHDGDPVTPGTALIAPGGNRHLVLRGRWPDLRVMLEDGPPVCFSTPSVDVLFRSAARQIGTHCAAALLTGMGKDGAEGMLHIRRAGGRTIAQDEETSVVWGMPGQAAFIGAAEQILPLKYIAAALLDPPAAEHPLYRKHEGWSQ